MSVLNKYLYPIGFAAMLFSSSAMAKIHPTAFKGVTSFFLKGKEFYSPTLGEVGLESGLMEDIRFYGPFEAAYKDKEERNFINDKSSDPLWNVVKILFPSNNGQLGTETTATSNLGKYVKDPKTVALLINYAKDLREGGKVDSDKLAKDIFETLRSEDQSPSRTLRKGTLVPLLGYIKDAIADEKAGKSIYPDYMTEQVLLAYFCYQFNTQEDIWTLLKDLDGSIVDKSKTFPTQTDYLKEEDFSAIAQKQMYNLDDIFDLSLADSWHSLTPYKERINLLNNGNAFRYDRKENKYIKENPFGDCAETAGRHLGNLLLFNPEKQEFDLTYITAHVKKHSPDNPYFKNFLEFYEKQAPFLANAGDIGTRSLWNKVLADLNAFGEGPSITYVKDTNELETGFINFIRIFQKVFSLPLKEFPGGSLRQKKTWVEESLNTLFSALNPTYNYDIDLNVSESDNELSGNALITVKSQTTRKPFFSFDLSSVYKYHSKVAQLKILKKTEKKEDVTASLKNTQNTLHKGTAEESLWLLAPSALKENIHHPLYRLYSQALTDNASKINFLKTLRTQYTPAFVEDKGKLPLLQSMIKNVLMDLSWSDEAVLKEVSPVICSMVYTPAFQEPLSEVVKVLTIEKVSDFDKITEIIHPLRKLEKLKLDGVTGRATLTSDFEHIKNLNLDGSDVDLSGFENAPHLEELNLCSKNDSSSYFLYSIQLSFTTVHKELKVLNLAGSDIVKLTGLQHLTNLQKLNLNSTKKLTDVSFPEPLEKLESLSFTSAGVQHLTNLGNLPNLESLSLLEAAAIQEVSFDKLLSKLKTLHIGGQAFKTLKGLEYTPNLELLSVGGKNFKNISFPAPLNKIKKVSLTYAEISNIPNLNNLSNVETLELYNTQLENLLFTVPFKNLTSLNLSQSSIKTIDGLDFLENLKELNLYEAKNIKKLTFTKENKELVLKLKGSGITEKDIEGIENLDRMKISF